MTSHRRYYFVHPDPVGEGVHDNVLQRLEEYCAKYWWFNEPKVNGEALGRLLFEFTSSGRDQWWCHVRAMNLATSCYMAAGMSESSVPEPLWERLEPHSNRGRYRIPKDPEEGDAPS